MSSASLKSATKGRGAVAEVHPRFEPLRREAEDDGWGGLDAAEDPDFPPPTQRTTVSIDASRSALARNDSPDLPFDWSVNPYRGCEHGCAYCYARPTHAYLGLSPGLAFETELWAKPELPALLDAALRKPSHRPTPIQFGAATDCWQPIERRYQIARAALAVCAAFHQPVSVTTKSALILRDLDLLVPMAREGLVQVLISLTSLDRALTRALEPRAAAPHRRLETIRALRDAGVPVGVLVAPVIPGLTDHSLEEILTAAAEAGAQAAETILLRLPLEVETVFSDWLTAHAPERKAKVLSLLRQCRGGKLYDARFGARMVGDGPIAHMLRRRAALAKARLGLDHPLPPLDSSRFRPPPRVGDQLSLL